MSPSTRRRELEYDSRSVANSASRSSGKGEDHDWTSGDAREARRAQRDYLALGGTAYGAAKFTGVDIIDNSIFAADIGLDGVTSSEIAANAVGSSEIATGAVRSSEIASDAVRSDEIAVEAVRSDEVENDALLGGDILESSLVGVVKGTGEVWDFHITQEVPVLLTSYHITGSNVDLLLECVPGAGGLPFMSAGIRSQTGDGLEHAFEEPDGDFGQGTLVGGNATFGVSVSGVEYLGFFRIQAWDSEYGGATTVTGFMYPSDTTHCEFRGQALTSY